MENVKAPSAPFEHGSVTNTSVIQRVFTPASPEFRNPLDKSAQYPCLPSFASACLVAVFSGVSGSSAGRFLDGVVMIPPMPFAMMELELSQVDPKWLHKQTMPLSGHVCKYSKHNSSC